MSTPRSELVEDENKEYEKSRLRVCAISIFKSPLPLHLLSLDFTFGYSFESSH
jgi:hypothetical protein